MRARQFVLRTHYSMYRRCPQRWRIATVATDTPPNLLPVQGLYYFWLCKARDSPPRGVAHPLPPLSGTKLLINIPSHLSVGKTYRLSMGKRLGFVHQDLERYHGFVSKGHCAQTNEGDWWENHG